MQGSGTGVGWGDIGRCRRSLREDKSLLSCVLGRPAGRGSPFLRLQPPDSYQSAPLRAGVGAAARAATLYLWLFGAGLSHFAAANPRPATLLEEGAGVGRGYRFR